MRYMLHLCMFLNFSLVKLPFFSLIHQKEYIVYEIVPLLL